MKSFIASLIIILAASSLSFSLASLSNSRLDEIVSLTEQILHDECKSDVSRLAIELIVAKWEESEKLFHITIARGDIAMVKKEIASAHGASRAGSTADFLSSCERLAALLDNVKGYTTCRLENIF